MKNYCNKKHFNYHFIFQNYELRIDLFCSPVSQETKQQCLKSKRNEQTDRQTR